MITKGWHILLVLVIFAGCKDKNSDPVDLGHDFFPVNPGTWVEYDVDSIVHDPFNQRIDTFEFFVREVIESEFTDLEGRTSQRIERFKRESDTMPWRLTDVWTAIRTSTTAERVEENERFIKLAFPVGLNDRWDGNAFNLKSEEEYEYTEVDVSALVNGLTYSQSLTVLQFDNSNLIEREFGLEKYARDIGMIYKEFTILDLQRDSGLDLRMELISYGK